jgi:LPXTG-motif cell wall-anchored protein/uncharacterized repeat protein (TIGR01451 family)
MKSQRIQTVRFLSGIQNGWVMVEVERLGCGGRGTTSSTTGHRLGRHALLTMAAVAVSAVTMAVVGPAGSAHAARADGGAETVINDIGTAPDPPQAEAAIDDIGTAPDPAQAEAEIYDIGTAPDPGQAADLAIATGASTAVPYVAHSFDWIITVTNNGVGSATSVEVSDVVPATVTVLSATSPDSNCTVVGNSVTCTRADLAAGSGFSIDIDVMVPASLTPQTVTNSASVTSVIADPDPTNNSSSSSVLTVVALVGGPDQLPTIPTVTTSTPDASTLPTISTTGSTPDFTDTLPQTGANIRPMWLIAAQVLLLVGVGLLILSKRRRPITSP